MRTSAATALAVIPGRRRQAVTVGASFCYKQLSISKNSGQGARSAKCGQTCLVPFQSLVRSLKEEVSPQLEGLRTN